MDALPAVSNTRASHEQSRKRKAQARNIPAAAEQVLSPAGLDFTAVVEDFASEVERLKHYFPRLPNLEDIVAEAIAELWIKTQGTEATPIGPGLFRTCVMRRAIDASRELKRESKVLKRISDALEPGHRRLRPPEENG